MITWLETWIRAGVARHLRNERGQDLIVTLLLLFILWLLIAGRRVVVE